MSRFIACLLAISAGSVVAQSSPDSALQVDSPRASIATLIQVSKRNAAGKIEEFTDARGRRHAVTYDGASQVQAVRKSADRVYFDDLLIVTHADDGRLVIIRFGDGNIWLFSYAVDGIQQVQDRYGNLVTRKVEQDGSSILLDEADATHSMAANVAKLDRLLSALDN
ncbi:MAG: hypothetical protein WDO72_07805 [Pseudomonadota bacterium]